MRPPGTAPRNAVRWRTVPAPVRGEFVRRLGEKLREHKASLAAVQRPDEIMHVTVARGTVETRVERTRADGTEELLR